jgi:hypothetical protein
MSDALERFATVRARFIAARRHAVYEWVRERGGTLGMDDMAAYEPIERRPSARALRARVLTNPPPSSGDPSRVLLGLLSARPSSGVEEIVAATRRPTPWRWLPRRIHDPEYGRFHADLDEVAARIKDGDWVGGHGGAGGPDGAGGRLDSTRTWRRRCRRQLRQSPLERHRLGGGGPGTGVHLNNMLGERT